MRTELLKHIFHFGVKSGLHVTELEIGQVYDAVDYQNGKWVKSRWERTKKKSPKRVKNEETGEYETIWIWCPAFYFRDRRDLTPDEIQDIIQSLQAMDTTINSILREFYEEIYEPAMLFESAWRNHTLSEHRTSIEEFKEKLYQTIGNDFDLDAKLTMFRIICAEVWATNQAHQRQYLE